MRMQIQIRKTIRGYIFCAILLLMLYHVICKFLGSVAVNSYDGSNHIKYWFLKDGHVYPSKGNPHILLFKEGSGNRIIEQLMYVPDLYEAQKSDVKLILVHSSTNKLGEGGVLRSGSVNFKDCPVNQCILTTKKTLGPIADAIIYKDHNVYYNITRPPSQVWIHFDSECPDGTRPFRLSNIFNWTITYRSDSDIVVPHGMWYYYDINVKFKVVKKNYAAEKNKKIAWFVSSCSNTNGRMDYAKELSKYIQLDMYGGCGNIKCPRIQEYECMKYLSNEYKFYLAFEEFNCREYITDKNFWNGLLNFMIPIVMGAPKRDFAMVAPNGSYIHVDDFFSAKELANYLHEIDRNDTLYNSYFSWRGTGELITSYTFFYCRLCAMLHSVIIPKHYEDINKWWRPAGICVYNPTWNKY